MYGSVGAVAVIPKWFKNALLLASVIFAIALVFIILLRVQVKKATFKIKQRETTLRESENKFRTMVETFPLAVIMTSGIDQTTQYLNSTMFNLFGYTKDDIPTITRWWALAYPDEDYRMKILSEWKAKIKKSFDNKTPMVPVDTVVTCKDASKKYISWGYIPMANEGYSFGLDLTDYKNAENKIKNMLAEKELLLVEVHHRIKNNMNTIKGLLSLQSSAEKEPSVVASLREAESRVQSIIMLYDRLYCTDNYRELSVKTYFEALVAEIVGGYRSSNKITTKTDIQDVILNIQLLTPLGIIVNELISNIMKHAFNGRERGQVTVSASFDAGRGSIVVRDDGIGLPEPLELKQSTGFGMRLIGMLIEQLNGTIRTESEDGTKTTIEFCT